MPSRGSNRMIAKSQSSASAASSSKGASKTTPTDDLQSLLLKRLLDGDGRESPSKRRYMSKGPDREAGCFGGSPQKPPPNLEQKPDPASPAEPPTGLAGVIADAQKALKKNKKNLLMMKQTKAMTTTRTTTMVVVQQPRSQLHKEVKPSTKNLLQQRPR